LSLAVGVLIAVKLQAHRCGGVHDFAFDAATIGSGTLCSDYGFGDLLDRLSDDYKRKGNRPTIAAASRYLLS
jgi:hypothetical protein